MSPRASSLAAFSSSSSSDAMYYDRHSNLELCFDAAEDDFRLRRLYHEMPDRMGYLPSYRCDLAFDPSLRFMYTFLSFPPLLLQKLLCDRP